MSLAISDKVRQFALRIKSHLQNSQRTIGVFFQALKLDNAYPINQQALIKMIEEANLEKSVFNPFKLNDQFRRAGQNVNIQKFKQIYERILSETTTTSPQVKPNKKLQYPKKQEIKSPKKTSDKTIQEKPISQKKIETQKSINISTEIIQTSNKPDLTIIERKERPATTKPAAQTIKKQQPKDSKKNAHQSVFEDQTPDYVIRQIKALIASDSRTLPLLFKEAELQNVIFIKRQHIKRLISKIKIECLRNEALVQSIVSLIIKKQRMSRYQLEVFFDQYGKNKKTNQSTENCQKKDCKVEHKTTHEQSKMQIKVQVQTKVTPKPAQQKKPQAAKKIEQKSKPQPIKTVEDKKKSISTSTQTNNKSPIFRKLQKNNIQKEPLMHSIDCQTIQSLQQLLVQKKQIRPIKTEQRQVKREVIPNKKDAVVKKDKVQTKMVVSIKQKQPINRDTSHSRLNIREKTNEVTRKLFSSQQKSSLLVRNRLQNKKQSVVVNPKQSKDRFLLASHYFRLNSHTTQQQKDCMIRLQQLLKHKQQFVDKDNPATLLKSHAYAPINSVLPDKDYIVVNKSASQPITSDVIHSRHVIQGQVGNCYLISVLATLAAVHPKKISELILFQANPANYLAVRLFINGEWRIIETDNRFACQDGRVCYAKSFKNEIWAMLIEKAFAKVYGSYKEIESGSPLESFFALTGAPCEQYYYKTQKVQVSQLVKVLKTHLSQGYLMGAAVDKAVQNETKQSLKQKGLIMDHAYSLLDVVDVQNKLYVKMRNPWSNEVIWKGNWSQISKTFSNQTKAKLNHDYEQRNGVFFMEWKNFYKYFNEVSICKINPSYFHTTLRLNFNKRKSNYIKLTIKKEGSYNIFICQQSQRQYKSTFPFFSASSARLIIMKRDEIGQLTYISSKNTSKSQVCSEDVYLESGVYIISAKIKWENWPDHQATLVSYGVAKVQFELITNRMLVPTFKNSLIDQYILQNKGKEDKFVSLGQEPECVSEYKYFSMSEGIGYMRIVNTAPKSYTLKYDFNISGMKVIKPRENTVVVELSQGQQQRIGFFVEPSGYNFHYSIKLIRF